MPQKDTLVIIPAFNEEDSIGLVLKNLPRQRVQAVIVVNNGSTDQTKQRALAHGALVVDEPRRGYGRACLTGIEKAYGLESKASFIAFLDGDFSDDPRDLTSLLEEIDRGYDLVIGSRTQGGAQRGALLPQAIFGNWLATTIMKFFWSPRGFFFTDLGPFRVMRATSLRELQMRDEDFGWTVEMQAKALLKGLKCSEICVSYKKRVGVSKITGTFKGSLRAGYKILKTLFALKISSYWSSQK